MKALPACDSGAMSQGRVLSVRVPRVLFGILAFFHDYAFGHWLDLSAPCGLQKRRPKSCIGVHVSGSQL